MPNTSAGRKHGPGSGNVGGGGGGGDQSDGGSGQKSQQRSKAARVPDEVDKKVCNVCSISTDNLREKFSHH